MDSKRILRRRAIQQKTGLPTSSMYALIDAGRFPKPIRLAGRSVGRIEAEVDAWIEARIAESRSRPRYRQGRERESNEA